MKSFGRKLDRLDSLKYNPLGGDYSEYFVVMKIVRTLPYGGSAVIEESFSVNAACLAENLREESLIGQRLDFDAISTKDGVEALDVNKDVIHCIRNASASLL